MLHSQNYWTFSLNSLLWDTLVQTNMTFSCLGEIYIGMLILLYVAIVSLVWKMY